MSDKAIITCALTGINYYSRTSKSYLPDTLIEQAKHAYESGASIIELNFRDPMCQSEGHLNWDIKEATRLCQSIRDNCPNVLLNISLGYMNQDDSSEECHDALNSLKNMNPDLATIRARSISLSNLIPSSHEVRDSAPCYGYGTPNSTNQLLGLVKKYRIKPVIECTDTGMVRSIGMYTDVGMVREPIYSFIMGLPTGMPTDTDLLSLIMRYKRPGYEWQVTALGQADTWAVQQKAADLGGHLRIEQGSCCFLPNGQMAKQSSELIEVLVKCARNAGRGIATPADARKILLDSLVPA